MLYSYIMNRKMPALIPELKVSDFKRSLEFYVALARFEVEYERPENEFAMLSREGAWLMIESLADKSRAFDIGILERPFGRGMHFQIEVSNAQELYYNFKNNDYPLFMEMEERWYRRENIELGNRQFLVQDPDGYLLRFFQDIGERPRGINLVDFKA